MANIDPTNPADNAIVSQYPTNERASRLATETNLYLEHGTDVGRHKFPVGNDAARDAITNWFVGSFFLNTSRTPAVLQRTISIDPDVWENVERTNAQLKTDYEGEADTNAFTDALLTKLNGVSAGAGLSYDIGGHISGMGTSNNGTHDIDIATGVCSPDNWTSVAAQMKLTSTLTKQIDVDWVVGNNQGGFPSGLTLNNSTWYHIFIIKRPDTGVVDAGFDTSITASNLLTDAGAEYTVYRRIGSVYYLSSVIQNYNQYGDRFDWDAGLINNLSGSGSTGGASLALRTPSGIVTIAHINMTLDVTSNNVIRYGVVTPLFATNTAPSIAFCTVAERTSPAGDVWGSDSNDVDIITNTSSEIRQRVSSNASAAWYIGTRGWTDLRGRE